MAIMEMKEEMEVSLDGDEKVARRPLIK